MLRKKIEVAADFLKKNTHLFRCPICHSAFLTLQATSFSCGNGHQFDLSKKGTLYFVNHMIQSDYKQELFENRYQMIQLGMYDPMLETIQKILSEQTDMTMLDAGCGEGSFLEKVSHLGLKGEKIGFDLSKDAVQMATQRSVDAFWCVADMTNLPFSSNQFDSILNIFSPSHYQEFTRVLKPDGLLVKVVPEGNYLKELRQLFYEDQKDKQSYSNQKVIDKFSASMEVLAEKKISYSFPITTDSVGYLLKMSPLQWSSDLSQLTQEKIQGIREITVDVKILVGSVKK